MCRILRLIVPALTLQPALWTSLALAGQQPEPEKKARSAAEQYESMAREYEAAEQAFLKKFENAKNAFETIAAVAMAPSPEVYAERFLELAKQHPRDDAAIDALIWIGSHARGTLEWFEALHLIEQDHLKNPKLGELCPHLPDEKPAEKLLRAVMENSPHRDVQGEACYRLAELLHDRPEPPRGMFSGYARMFGKARDSANPAEEAERLFDRVVARYGDVRSSRGTLGDRARAQLFEIRNLVIGKPAPEIDGEDADGRRFKLSDYRGKVVVLDFWGDW